MKLYDFGTILLALALIVAGSYIVVDKFYPKAVENNEIVETIVDAAEDFIESQTGIDIDVNDNEE